jgi:uncharacterized membrane protein YkoI
MKKNALVTLGFLVSLVSAGVVVGQDFTFVSNFTVSESAKVTVEQARAIALKRVEGKVEDEYAIEDEDENITAYVFIIKNKQDKTFEVQVSAADGKIISVEEQKEEEEESEDPPATEEVESTEVETTEVETTEVESTEVESTEVESTEVESTEVESTEVEEDTVNKNNADDNVAQLKITMEQARAKALKKAKGEIQSEELIEADGKAYYAFMIKGKKDKMTEVRVDANSGKAKKLKNKKADTEG